MSGHDSAAKWPSADRIGGLIWLVFGAAIAYGSWTMDRLERLQIPPATAPGLVPGLLGIGIIMFALVLLFRSEARAGGADEAAQETGFHWKRMALSWLLCMGYGGLLLGRGVPYWMLTATFLFLHILLIDDNDAVPARPTGHRIMLAIVMALCVSTVVALVFQNIFLVRLP